MAWGRKRIEHTHTLTKISRGSNKNAKTNYTAATKQGNNSKQCMNEKEKDSGHTHTRTHAETETKSSPFTNRDINVELTSDSVNPDLHSNLHMEPKIPFLPNICCFSVFCFVFLLCFVFPFIFISSSPNRNTKMLWKCFKVFRPIQKHHQKYEANINKMLKYVLCIENGVHYVCMHGGKGGSHKFFSGWIFSVCNTHTPTKQPTEFGDMHVIDLNHKI